MNAYKLISKSAVRKFVRQNGKRLARETFDQLDEEVKALLLKAEKRAEKNKRSTIMPHDL